MKNLIKIIAVVALFSGCTPKRLEIPTYWEQTPAQAFLASKAHANDMGGTFFIVAPTGSMEPFMIGGDYIVVKPIKYEEIKPGMMLNYQARWLPSTSSTVTHWAASMFGGEWIMDGQHNSHYEKGDNERMGPKEFRGQVVAIYTQRKKP